MTYGLMVVGGGAAGLAAATAYRTAGGSGGVRVVSDDTHAPYFRPLLSKELLRGEADEDELPLETATFYAEHGIVLSLASRVESLDPQARSLTLEDGEALSYEACILATGSKPSTLGVPGEDDARVLRLRTAADGARLRSAAQRAETAVVVGSGFIGCEAAASLASTGISVTMVSDEPQPQAARLGEAVASRIGQWLAEAGVTVVGGSGVESIEDGRQVRLDDGTTYAGDLVLMAVGHAPRIDLAESAGGTCRNGLVVVDQSMRTDLRDVYAAGDVALAHNGAARRHLAVEHWGEATRMGEVAGTVAAGGDDSWAQVPGFWTQIGAHTLKYASWGDGYDTVEVVDHDGAGFTAWYGADGETVGVLAYEADADYERGSDLIEKRAAFPPSR